VSATISLKEDEWDKAGKWMWDNRECYNGLSVLPYDGGTYTQAPFEDITEQEFNKRVKLLNDVDLSNIVETTDETDLSGELACAGGCLRNNKLITKTIIMTKLFLTMTLAFCTMIASAQYSVL
jgi:hypothetical protein